MPRKKSLKKAARDFVAEVVEIENFIAALGGAGVSKAHTSWAHDYAIIRLYREFERLMLNSLVGAVNNDTETLSSTTGIDFPKHLTNEVCEYLITGGGYFDFRGRDGLIRTLRKYVPDGHYLVQIIKAHKYKDSLEQLAALRNYAAHDSQQSKEAAKKVTGATRLASAGAWLKKNRRLTSVMKDVKALATEIEAQAPY